MTPISKQTLVSFLFDQGYSDVRATDDNYALPLLSWVTGGFSAALLGDQRRRGMERYLKAKNNCTKFTRAAAVYAAECHLDTEAGANNDAALAFGVFDFITTSGTGHSVNIVVIREGTVLRARFFDPQPRRLVTVMVKEGTTPAVQF